MCGAAVGCCLSAAKGNASAVANAAAGALLLRGACHSRPSTVNVPAKKTARMTDESTPLRVFGERSPKGVRKMLGPESPVVSSQHCIPLSVDELAEKRERTRIGHGMAGLALTRRSLMSARARQAIQFGLRPTPRLVMAVAPGLLPRRSVSSGPEK